MTVQQQTSQWPPSPVGQEIQPCSAGLPTGFEMVETEDEEVLPGMIVTIMMTLLCC